ncbi:hypothetical protein [Pediococcus cellicola]|uniref:Uncharacterized protein n=1 Tax=Pediococcus cellicola TaxID=319652 RepID=A0A0R2ING7_9LACO|nr:hypothetical protein [Pediococcus cellicola]KRN66222.1 hypothetical protein IV80_GL001471 [Pediococcus cellicola]GEL15210.1 hypothetical protein PCE01_10120 [Pediococcus cellicola]
MREKYDPYLSAILSFLEFLILVIGWQKVSGVWNYFTADIMHSFKGNSVMYIISNPFNFHVGTTGLHVTYPFAVGYCLVLIIQYGLLWYALHQFAMGMKAYFHLQKAALAKYFNRISLSFVGTLGTVLILQILDSVLAKRVRLFQPDFWLAIVGTCFLIIAFHYVGSIITNINRFAKHKS